jgi:phosphoserine phosphatase
VTEGKIKKNTAAFFDVDNTLVRGSTAFLYAKVAIEIGVFKRTDIWRMSLEQLRFIWRGENNDRLANIKDRGLSLIAGASRDDMHSLMQKVWEKEIQRKVWPEMVDIVQHHLSLRRSWAYSDSRNDLPLLTLVKHPVAVNPDKILKRHARLANWQILNFGKKDLKK